MRVPWNIYHPGEYQTPTFKVVYIIVSILEKFYHGFVVIAEYKFSRVQGYCNFNDKICNLMLEIVSFINKYINDNLQLWKILLLNQINYISTDIKENLQPH